MKKMNTPITRPTLRGLVLALAALALSGFVASAHPYASGVTVTGSALAGGTVHFNINESGGSVGVYFPDNNSTNYLGVLSAGTNYSFAFGPGTNHYQIYVFKTGSGQVNQISSDTYVGNNFYSPRGVAVNNNPSSPNFGRIYVTTATTGSLAAGAHQAARSTGRGLYVLAADSSDVLGYGQTVKSPGMTFQASSYSPFRCYVGPDDTLFVGSATTLANGAFLGYANANLTSGGYALNGTNNTSYSAGENHTLVIGTPAAQGSIGQGNLVVRAMDAYYAAAPATGLSILQWNIGSTYNSTVTPTVLAVSGLGAFQTVSDSYSTSTNNYILLDRSSNTMPAEGEPCLQVFDTGNNVLWDSWDNTSFPGVDVLNQCGGMSISPDGQLIAIGRLVDNGVTLMYLTNGIPNEATLFTNQPAAPVLVGSYAGIAFDSAENLYSVNNGPALLRIYSLGLTTTAITANDATGANGTFQLIIPGTQVNVAASIPNASQNGGSPISGQFTITRSGSVANLNQGLTVNFTFGGTATEGVNYTVSPPSVAGGSVYLPPNVLSTNITITPTPGGSLPTLTVLLTLSGSAYYSAQLPGFATVTIANTGPQLVFVSGVAAPSMYLALSNDFASFTLTRWGDTNVTTVASSYMYGGSAQAGTDYTYPAAITFNPGDVSYVVPIYPLLGGVVPSHASHPYVGNKTAIISYAGANSSSNAVMTIIDDADPPATVLFYDPLTNSLTGGAYPTGVNDTYASWSITYANDNMDLNVGPDYDVEFGYDLTSSPSANGLIPFPPNGSQYAMRVTCNKSLGQAAGVNIYPTNVTFSGNYAIRFNMNLIECGNTAAGTEGMLFGMNHAGIYTNWFSASGVTDPTQTPYPWASDGIFAWIEGDPGGYGAGDFTLYTGNGGKLPNTGWMYLSETYAPYFINNFKGPAPYTTAPSIPGDYGVPSNQSPLYGSPSVPPNTWSDVELKQVNNVVTFSINKTPVFTYVNTNSFTNGTLMFGYNDPYDSLGSSDGAAYFSNLRVVQLGAPYITSIVPSGANLDIYFTITDGDYTSITVQSTAAIVNGPNTWATVAGATITSLGSGAYEAVVPKSGNAQFYRIAAH